MKIDTSKYDYIMYVDASGDDGFKFDHDSSTCYAAAALLVKQEDIAHNLDILNQIKHIVGCKPTDEVKYSRVRRHRRGDEALSLLMDIRGKMSSYVVFKKEVDRSKYIGNKHLSIICHMMALRSINSYAFEPPCKILAVIDRMKQTEEKPLEILFENNIAKKNHIDVDVAFRDSKDSNFLLIQIADLLCGIIREHFEQYDTQKDMVYFSSLCPNCIHLHNLKRPNLRPMCKSGRSRTSHILNANALKYIFPLFPTTKGSAMLDYFFVEPLKMMYQHYYLICQLKK